MINIYTDGAYSPKYDKGGWAFYCPQYRAKVCSGEYSTTNNRMEMAAAINALTWVLLAKLPIQIINVYSDSLYVINTMNGYYQMKTNIDLWQQLNTITKQLEVKGICINWNHVKGHAGHAHNEVVDLLANLMSQIKLIK